MNNSKIVESIKKLCKDHNIAVSQLEKEIRLSQGLVSKWMNTTPSLDKIVDIADYFHVSIDEVVGHNNIINDKFLEKLIVKTEDKSLIWCTYYGLDEEPRQYDPPTKKIEHPDSGEYEESGKYYKHVSYYTEINNGYISIYGCYEYQDILNPKEIKIFIQSDIFAPLIEQDYSYEQLKVLWLKILYSFGDKAPDEVKVEEFKNNFILDDLKSNNKYAISKKTNLSEIQNMLSSPEIVNLMEIYSQPGFQELQKTISSQEFQKAMQTANIVQKQLEKLNISNK